MVILPVIKSYFDMVTLILVELVRVVIIALIWHVVEQLFDKNKKG